MRDMTTKLFVLVMAVALLLGAALLVHAEVVDAVDPDAVVVGESGEETGADPELNPEPDPDEEEGGDEILDGEQPADPVVPDKPADPGADKKKETKPGRPAGNNGAGKREKPAARPADDDPVDPAPETYEILYVFYDNMGERLVVEKVAEGDPLQKPAFTPEVDGYAFLFWYNPEQEFEDDIIVEFEFGFAPAGDMKLKALYMKDAAEGEEGEGELMSAPAWDEEELTKREILKSGFIRIIDDPVDDDEDNDDVQDLVVVDDDEDDDDDEDENAVELAGIDDGEIPLAGPDTSGCQIILSSNHGACVAQGDTLTVRAQLIGYEGFDVALQWLYNDGSGWVEAPGATGMSHSFEATRDSVRYDWQLAVTITGIK